MNFKSIFWRPRLLIKSLSNMFVNASMSEMLNVGGSRAGEGPGPKPEEEGVAHSPLMEDIISSSPASPASTNGEVPNPVSPMPLLPQFLFNGRNNHQQASTPPREPSGSSTSGPPSLPRVQKRLELSPLPHPQHHHPHHQGHGGHTSGGKMPLNLQGGVTVGHPRMRTDPGAPPGCTEHSLNILGGHYLLLDHLEGSHLQRCIDVNTKQEYVCKVRIEFFIHTYIHTTLVPTWNLISSNLLLLYFAKVAIF